MHDQFGLRRLEFRILHDRFFSFWLRYVFPFRSRLEIGNTGYLLAKTNETFEQHLAFVYEDIYRDLRRKAQLVGWGGKKRQEQFILFSRNGFTTRMLQLAKQDGVVLVTREELMR